MGGDVGVFRHGDNAREMELMVEYGMKPSEVLRSTTSINADVFGYGNAIGRLKTDLFADIIAVQGNPVESISAVRNVTFVMKDGVIYKSGR
jgi:imidazolonepropionase-like amidohydrolase